MAFYASQPTAYAEPYNPASSLYRDQWLQFIYKFMEDKLPVGMKELQSQEMRMPRRSEEIIKSEEEIEKEFRTATESIKSKEVKSSDTELAAMPEDYAVQRLVESTELSPVIGHWVKAERQLLTFGKLESVKLEDIERNDQTAQLCETQLGPTQYTDGGGSFETFSDVEISDEQSTTVPEVALTEDATIQSKVLSSSLRACSVLLSPLKFDCNNNPVVKSGRKSPNDFDLVTPDLITEASDSQKTTPLEVICQSTCDSGVTRATHSGPVLDGTEISASRSGKRVNHKADLVNYGRVHTLNQSYECTLCARAYATKKNLVLHYKLHTNEGLYGCQHCEEKFTSRADRACHRSTHVKERPFQCTICGMAFCHRSNLKRHAIVHSNARNHTCSVCDESFKTLDGRNKHMIVHTADQPWECDYCKKHYKTEKSLQRHLVIHDKLDIGAGLFSCEYCGKKFSSRISRERHHRIHTKERPFKCTICEMAFRQPSALKAHTANCHVDVKNYACSSCDKSFKTLCAITKHMVVHTDEKPWKCDYCKKHFKRKGSLQPHFTHCKERPSIRKL